MKPKINKYCSQIIAEKIQHFQTPFQMSQDTLCGLGGDFKRLERPVLDIGIISVVYLIMQIFFVLSNDQNHQH